MIIADGVRYRGLNNLYWILLYTATITVFSFLTVYLVFCWPTTSSWERHHQPQPQKTPRKPENVDGQFRVDVSGAASGSITPSLPCDDECVRFGRLLDTWPADKPKAAVIVLLGSFAIGAFAKSLRMFSANFNDAFVYPVIVFHEEKLNNTAYRQHLRSFTNSSLYFQVVSLCVYRHSVRFLLPLQLCNKY